MASTPKRSKKMKLSKETCAMLYAKFINNDIDLEEAFGGDLFQFLDLYSRSRGTTPGLLLPTMVVATNFILGYAGCTVKVGGDHVANLNTFVSIICFRGCSTFAHKWLYELQRNIHQKLFFILCIVLGGENHSESILS